MDAKTGIAIGLVVFILAALVFLKIMQKFYVEGITGGAALLHNPKERSYGQI